MTNLLIADLNDDCLIEIFKLLPLSTRLDLPFVCKRFYLICKSYELNAIQLCLGTTINEANCDYQHHRISNEDTIFNLMLERKCCNETKSNWLNFFNPHSSLNNKFRLPRRLFEQLLIKCTRLKVLSLRLIDTIDNRLTNLLIKYCNHLEHLTISTTTIQVTNLVWLELCTSVCVSLKCLNLEYVDNLTEHLISNVLRKSIRLEQFAITGNSQLQLNGYFFENLNDKIKTVSIRKIDSFTNHGTVALISLIAGHGKKISKLCFKGHLSSDFLNQINLIQKNFKNLEDLELGDSLEDSSTAFQRILGQAIAKINSLKKISFNLPQLTPFTITLNSFQLKLIELNRQKNLQSFRLTGGEISDKSIGLLCSNFKQLNEFHLSHSSYFARENCFQLTKRIFKHMLELSELTNLTINGLNLDDFNLSLILMNCKRLKRIDLRNCYLISNKSLINLDFYAQEVEHAILVYLWGTSVILLKLDENYQFTYPSNLRISFEALQDNLMDFDVIEDDLEFI